MITLDDALLRELGLGDLTPIAKNRALAHLHQALEMRVGTRLASAMSTAQLEEFEYFIDAEDHSGALSWLGTNFPGYKRVVAQEFTALRAEAMATVAVDAAFGELSPHYQLTLRHGQAHLANRRFETDGM